MKGCDKLADAGRRAFFARTAAAAAGAAVTAALPAERAKAASAGARFVYPSTRLAAIGDLKVNEPVTIAYPDAARRGSESARIGLHRRAENAGLWRPDSD